MQKSQQLVREFHEKFGVEIAPSPRIPSEDICVLRIDLLLEEVRELSLAMEEHDLVGVADALADIQYVLDGTALCCGMDIESLVEEVHRSNMTKVWPDGTVHRRPDGKIMKFPGFQPPDLAAILRGEKK